MHLHVHVETGTSEHDGASVVWSTAQGYVVVESIDWDDAEARSVVEAHVARLRTR